eukprot:1131113-Rhodomonas_salina.1
MHKEEHRGLLLTSFEARVLADTAEDEDEIWSEMKQRWAGHQQHASHGRLTIGKFFDLVEAGLKSRLRVAGGSAAVAEQTLDEQIREIIGQTQHDPNQAPRMRESPGSVGQKHALGGLASLTLGPALKLQADRSVAFLEDRAQVNTPSKHLRAPAAPVGRRRPRKGAPRQSPFEDDLWNDDPFDADLEEQQTPVYVGMASLSLGPALKAQFEA